MFRRGISAVVANVLIVLLVIASVAVIWAAVKPAIDKSAKQIESDCITVQVEPVRCVVDYSQTASFPNPPVALPFVNLTVKRNVGAGDLRGITLLFEGNIWSLTQPSGVFSYQVVASSEDPVHMPVSSFDQLETLSYSLFSFDVAGSDTSPLVNISNYNIPGAFAIGLGPKRFSVAAEIGPKHKACSVLSQPIPCTCITHVITPTVPVDLCPTINS